MTPVGISASNWTAKHQKKRALIWGVLNPLRSANMSAYSG